MTIAARSLLAIRSAIVRSLVSTKAAVASVLLTFAAGGLFIPFEAAACGNHCSEICWNGCNPGHHYSGQQAKCVRDNDINNGWCDDGYACGSGYCGGAGERACNTASTGCSSCFSGYYYDGGGINQYGSFNIDGVVFCGFSALCQPGCSETVTIPNPNDITFYVTGEMEFGRTSSLPEEHHKKHVRILNKASTSTPSVVWPDGTSGAWQSLAAPVGVVMAGDMTYTDQGDVCTTTMCERLAQMRRFYDNDRLRRRDPDANIMYPVFPGLGNHDACRPENCKSKCGETRFAQNYIMTKYMDMRLRNSAGGNCLGVTNYDGPMNGPYTSGFKSHNYSWNWGDYHLIQGNVWAGYLTSGDLTWLKNDLKANAGKPIIYIQHFGYEDNSETTKWWSADEQTKLFDALAGSNVVALIHGHDDPEMGAHYQITRNGRPYDVYRIPRSGKTGAGNDSGGFLAVRLRKTVADFAFFHYASGNDALTGAGGRSYRRGWVESGEQFVPDRDIWSNNGQYKLRFQSDGNIVLYTSSGGVEWASNTSGHSGSRLVMQTDGNLVLFSSTNQVIWQTYNNLANSQYSRLAVQDDGNVVIYNTSGTAIWSSRSSSTPNSYFFSGAGPLPGKFCISVNEPIDPHTWADNYFCSDRDIGMQWSAAGAIPGMRCTAITEAADPHAWHDNYLCLPWWAPNVNFAWSGAGAISGMNCVQWNEAADPYTWEDNFLCY